MCQKKILALVADVVFPEESRRAREEYLNQFSRPEFEVVVKAIQEGADYLESYYDQCLSARGIVSEVIKAEKEGFAAVLVLCMSDPFIDAAREVVDIPVIGSGQASFLTAVSLGLKFSIVTAGSNAIPWLDKLVRTSGCDYNSLASIRAIEMSIAEMNANSEKTLNKTIEVARQAIEHDGAHAIIMGCTEMGVHFKEEIESRLGVPIIEPNVAALGLAMFQLKANLRHSRKTYPKQNVVV